MSQAQCLGHKVYGALILRVLSPILVPTRPDPAQPPKPDELWRIQGGMALHSGLWRVNIYVTMRVKTSLNSVL